MGAEASLRNLRPQEAANHEQRRRLRRAVLQQEAKDARELVLRQIFAIVAGLIFFAVALSGSIYEATSPSGLPYHVFLRKFYSIAAFALVGMLTNVAWRCGIGRTMLIVAGYSTIIEIGQALMGSREGLVSNAIDILCGAIGGLFGSNYRSAITPLPRNSHPRARFVITLDSHLHLQ